MEIFTFCRFVKKSVSNKSIGLIKNMAAYTNEKGMNQKNKHAER